jgi:hypothetical protein
METQTDQIVIFEAEEAKAGGQPASETAAAAPEEAPVEKSTEGETPGESEKATEAGKARTPASAQAQAGPSTLEAIKNDPYDFDQCQVQVSILFLPRNGNEPRMAVCGVKTHDDDPLIETRPGDELLATLPADILGMLDRVKSQMPGRAMERMTKKQMPALKKKTPRPISAVPVAPARAASPAPVQAPHAPALKAPALQPDLFSMLGGAR